jgi:hypothetical protein
MFGHVNEEKQKYNKAAVAEVIKIFGGEGIKLTILDFRDKAKDTVVISFAADRVTEVKVFFRGRWGSKLKVAQDAFLKYANVTVRKEYIHFIFTWSELDLSMYANVSGDSDSDSEKLEKVKRKIEKLLSLADLEKNPSEQEAISASLKAQKLLAEYHLTMDEVLGTAPHKMDCESVKSEVGIGNSKFNWRWDLASAVASGYCCKYYLAGSTKSKGTVVFFGFKEDVILARRVFTYLFNVGNKLANSYAKVSTEPNAYQSFVTGFVSGVNEQLQKQCTALALVVQPEVKEAWDELIEPTITGHIKDRRKQLSADAFEEGKVEGKRVFDANYLE